MRLDWLKSFRQARCLPAPTAKLAVLHRQALVCLGNDLIDHSFHDTLEVNSTQKDRDLAAVVNWRAADKAVAEGKTEMVDGVPIIDPAKVPGVLYFVPIGKSPHAGSPLVISPTTARRV